MFWILSVVVLLYAISVYLPNAKLSVLIYFYHKLCCLWLWYVNKRKQRAERDHLALQNILIQIESDRKKTKKYIRVTQKELKYLNKTIEQIKDQHDELIDSTTNT